MVRRKHEESFKLKVVQEYLSEAVGAGTVALRHDLDHGTARRWVQRYEQHGEAGLRKKFSHYSAEFKLSVLQRMWQEELSFRQTAALFDVHGGQPAHTKDTRTLERSCARKTSTCARRWRT